MTPIYFFAWIASILYGLENIVAKLISKHSISNPWLFNFLWTLFILLLTIPISIFKGAGMPAHWENIIFASLFYALGSIFFILALYKLDVSVLAPLFSFRTAMAVILGALILGEILTLYQYILIGIIFISGIFVSFDERLIFKSFFNREIAIALAGMLSLVLMGIFIKKAVGEAGYWNATLWIALLAQVWILFTIPLVKRDFLKVTFRQYAAIFATAVVGTIATLAANRAYAINVSITAVILSLPISMLAALLFSVFAPELLERHTRKVYIIRFVSALFMLLPAIELSSGA